MRPPGYWQTLGNTLLKKLEDNDEPIPHRLERKDASRVLEEIAKEFEKCQNIKSIFKEADIFFNELLGWSYGLTFQKRGNNPNFESALVTQQEDFNNRFVKKIDLFCLIDYLLSEYPNKYQRYNGFSRTSNIHSIHGGELILEAGFNESFWDNIYNDYVGYAERSQNGNIREICIFNKGKHAIASYLHSSSQDIHYLTVRARGQHPICTAILIESQGTNSEDKNGEHKYLLVEGVLGDFTSL